MGCVNRSSKDFKFLAERNNVSINTLELITHKYWLEKGSEEQFPTSTYIQAQLGKTRYQESSKEVRDLWERDYSTPKKYNTLAEVKEAQEEALKYFPSEAVLYYKNPDNKFTFVVRQPMKKLNYEDIISVNSLVKDAQDQKDYDLVADSIIKELKDSYKLNDAKRIAKQKLARYQSPSITAQEIAQLKKMGIDVLDERAMPEYLNNNSETIQQALEEQREMDEIKAKAQADGTFMKAPNGKPTNLTERQWLQVRTKAFKKWFGDWEEYAKLRSLHNKYKSSIEIENTKERELWKKADRASFNSSAVIDENGEPLVVYHYNTYGKSDIRIFDENKSPNGFWLTTNSNPENIYFPNSPGENVASYPVFLNIRRGDINNMTNESLTIENGKTVRTPQMIPISSEQIQQIKKWGQSIVQRWTKDETFYAVFNPNQIKSATDNIGMFSAENDDIQMAVGRFVDKYSLPTGELPALSNALSSKFSNKTAYGDVIHTANYEYTVIYRGVEDFDIIEYHPIDNNLNNKVNDKDRRSAGSYDRLSARDELAEGECDSNSYDVTESEANKYNAGLDKETRQREAKQAQSDVSSEEHQGWYPIKRDSILGRVAFVKGDGRTISIAEEWNNALEKFVTPQGTVYGFATKDGKIYLDTRIIRPEHPIHEYTHLWDRAVIKNNRPLWNKGVTLMRQLDLWNEILNDKNYGRKWQKDGITGRKLTDLVASEVHSRLVGEQGQAMLENIANKKGKEGIIGKLKQWLLDVWKEVAQTFGAWTKEDLDNLTLEDFLNMTVRDFVNGLNPNKLIDQALNSDTQYAVDSSSNTSISDDVNEENYDLSNSISRPFNLNGFNFNSIEHFMQATKFHAIKHLMSWYGSKAAKTVVSKCDEILEKLNNAKDAKEARKIGEVQIKSRSKEVQKILDDFYGDENISYLSGINEWKRTGKRMLKRGLKASFEQNPQALQKLIDTGNSTFTYSRSEDIFDEAFPSILAEVREELKKEHPEIKPTQRLVQSQQPKAPDKDNLHVEYYDNRYTPRESSSIPALNEKAAALREAGWHIEFYDKKSRDDKTTNEVMTISLGNRANKGFFELVKDVDLATGLPNNDYSVHFKTRSKKGYGGNEYITTALTNAEKRSMFEALTWTIPDGANVSTWGELSEGGIHALDRFKEFGFTQTGTRKVRHKNGGDLTIPVFTKGTVQQTNTQQQAQQQQDTQVNQAPSYYEGDIKPEANTIFVFGSNPEGRHGAGAAKVAKEKFGAKYGQGEGLQGNAYALPTKDLRVKENNGLRSIAPEQIVKSIQKMYEVARQNPDKQFKVAYTHALDATSLNGYTGREMIQMFKNAGPIPSNVVFSKNWTDHWHEVAVSQQQQTTLPGPETKMDIWAGRGQQNPDLSNVAKRPFTLQLFEGENPIEFNSVEQAFQYTKFRLLSQFLGFEETKPFLLSNQKLTGEDYKDNVTAWVRRGVKAATLKNGNGLSAIGDSYEEEKEYIEKHIQKILSTKSSTYDFAVKALGGKNGGYTISGHSGSTFLDTIWSSGELVAEDVMKAAMKASFQQNTNALKRLLATGDATLTHVKGEEWAEAMPELLMEVRKELREEHPELMPNQQNTINDQNNSLNNNINYGNDFRRVQETIRKSSSQGQEVSSVSKRDIGKDARQRLARVLGNELRSQHGALLGGSRTDLTGKGNTFAVYSNVNPQLFHDFFEIARYYTPNGELVNLHDDYSDCKCYLNEDGTCGFAIEPNGNLISVFSLGTTRGFLWAIKDFAIQEGATHLDAYASSTQNLEAIYKKVFGAKTASKMDYNTDYDHDNIAKNHNNPQVVFMVLGEAAKEDVAEKHFNKDQYNEAQSYQQGYLSKQPATNTQTPEINSDNSRLSDTMINETPIPEPNGRVVELKGYEFFNDMLGGVYIDAEWKVSLLQDLDSQLSDDTTDQNNYAILNRMEQILEAKSEDEVQSNIPKKLQEQVNKELDDFDYLNQQIDNLNEGILTSTEVRHFAELMMNMVSDEVTKLQRNKNTLEEDFPLIKTEMDFSKVPRRKVIETIGISNLLNWAREQMNTETHEQDNLAVEQIADTIYENWDGIVLFGTDIFAMNEGFGIKRDYENGEFVIDDGYRLGYDDYNGQSDIDSIREQYGDDQEHWQVESRTLDILLTASEAVRMAIHNCYKLDKQGRQIPSIFKNINERVNPREAIIGILKWTQGAQSLEEMITRLNEKQAKYPWVKQLVKILSDKSGNETDFQSQFYGTMCKSFQSYCITTDESGQYVVMPLNENPALQEIIHTVQGQYRVGEHPLFEVNGTVKKDTLGSVDKVSDKDAFSLHKALASLNIITDKLRHKQELTEEMIGEAKLNLKGACILFGFEPTEEVMDIAVDAENIKYMTKQLKKLVESLDNALKKQIENSGKPNADKYNPFSRNDENSINFDLRNFFMPITDVMNDTLNNVVYDDGKLYQAYTTPSYLTLLMQKFQWEQDKFDDFIKKEYAGSEWFKFPTNSEGKAYGLHDGWRTPWMAILINDEHLREAFKHKVELNFNKHQYMRRMSDAEYTISLLANYWGESKKVDKTKDLGWFRIPMQSNKPSSEFVRMRAYKGSDFRDQIINGGEGDNQGMVGIFLQELSRIQTVNMRNREKNDPDHIANWDVNGRKFNFLPEFNAYLKDSDTVGTLLKDPNKDKELAKLIQKLENRDKLTTDDEGKLIPLVQEAIRNSMDAKVKEIIEDWQKKGILNEVERIENIGNVDLYPSIDSAYAAVENFLWNDRFAAMNILQMTLGDIAAYKNAEDLQKRLAQLHAPGVRANVAATDYEGNRISDGKYRTIIIKDWDNFKSNIIANIEEVFDKKIRNVDERISQLKPWQKSIISSLENEKKVLESLKDSLVRKPGTINAKDKGGAYWNINVADAQGYSSPSSYRKKAFMFGKWSRKSEEIYKKLLNNDYDIADLQTVFQPLKPFVYGQMHKDVSAGDSPIKTMNMPFQAKNAEYLLVMADALTRNEDTGRPNLLRAIYDVMEESERINPTQGIDTIQFESAIKSGKQGVIDLNQYAYMEGGEAAALKELRDQIYLEEYEDEAKTKRIYKNYNTRTFVHETSYDNYCLQQEVPEHFKGHEQAHGSQERMIIPSDLSPDAIYPWVDTNGKKKEGPANVVRREYEDTIADNIKRSIKSLKKRLHWFSDSQKDKNITLSKILQKEINDSPRYGIDLFQACSVDKETGEFRIPKGDPIQAKRIEQLLNSIIKNDINKQEIAGGPIVQVSNFGTSQQLHIRYNDKKGKLIPLEEEYAASKHGGKSYKEYLKENQAGIAYFEVFAPIWDDSLVEKFGNPDGTIDIEAIEATDPELLKMISYRIPTEDKYSIAPMKIVGFMPRWAGEAIMLPYELTTIDGSDFDVDKRYVMRKSLEIVDNTKDAILKSLPKEFKKEYASKYGNDYLPDQIDAFLKDPETMRDENGLMEIIYNEYRYIVDNRLQYKTVRPSKKKLLNDNKIIDITWGILTHEETADKILNPGGFEDFKSVGYTISAYKNPLNQDKSWEDLQKEEDIKSLSEKGKDLTWADTQVQFYKQNSAAASLIGVFAVNKVAHATLEGNDIWIDVNEMWDNDFPCIIGRDADGNGGTVFNGRMRVDPTKDNLGNYIGKTLGSGVTAAADAVKDPILNLMNINMTTAGMLNSMLRLGMPFEDAALFLSQSIIDTTLDEFAQRNLGNGYISFEDLIQEKLDGYIKKMGIKPESKINQEEITREELIEGLREGDHDELDYKVLLAFQKMQTLTDNMKNITFATRFNSISSAVGPLIIDNLILEHKMQKFDKGNVDSTFFYDSEGNMLDIYDIFKEHPVLEQFAEAVNIAKEMFRDMPAGSEGFRKVLAELENHGVIFEKIYKDKKLLSKLSDFYQSYMLIESGFIDAKEVDWYVDEFPKEFMKRNKNSEIIVKKKYADNALIQAIDFRVNRYTKLASLQVNITRMDEQEKQKLRCAWADLHKEDPDLSKKLYTYCFFRGGAGFSPQTFMALVPNYVKEHLTTTLEDGTTITYADVFRKLNSGVPETIVEQFILNNWQESKIAPKMPRGKKRTHYTYTWRSQQLDTMTITDQNELKEFENLVWVRITYNQQPYLFRLIEKEDYKRVYKVVNPLTYTNDRIVMSRDSMEWNLEDYTTKKPPKSRNREYIPFGDDVSETYVGDEITNNPPITDDEGETSGNTSINDGKESLRVADMIDFIMGYDKPNRKDAEDMYNIIKKDPSLYSGYLQKVFKKQGIELSRDEAVERFKDLC